MTGSFKFSVLVSVFRSGNKKLVKIEVVVTMANNMQSTLLPLLPNPVKFVFVACRLVGGLLPEYRHNLREHRRGDRRKP